MKLDKCLFTAFISLCGFALYAQEIPNGLLFDDEEYSQTPLIHKDSTRGSHLPWQVSLRPYCPTPGNQGFTSSCVGWSLAHALTVERAIAEKVKESATIDKRMHSATYIYNQIKLGDDCRSPAYLNAGLKLLKNKGDCLASDFENTMTECGRKPTERHHEKAAFYAVNDFQRIFEKNDSPDVKIDAIRSILAKNQPVLIGAVVPDGFRYQALDKLNWVPTKNGHAMVVVGYDDGKNEFEIMNSYGERWGSGGFFSVGYDDLAKCVYYGYRLVLNN